MKRPIHMVILAVLLGVVIGTLSVGPGALLSAGQKNNLMYLKKHDYTGHWAELYIQEAMINGIVNGYPDGSFKPDEPVTRAGFAAMLDKVIQDQELQEGTLDLAVYEDCGLIPDWAKGGFEKAIQLGWLNVYPDHTVRPLSPLLRSDITSKIPARNLPAVIFKNQNETVVTRAEACILISGILQGD